MSDGRDRCAKKRRADERAGCGAKFGVHRLNVQTLVGPSGTLSILNVFVSLLVLNPLRLRFESRKDTEQKKASSF